MQDDSRRITKQEAKENIFESLKSSIERSNYPASQLNTSAVYKYLKETLRENEAKQKLLDSDKNEFNETPTFEM